MFETSQDILYLTVSICVFVFTIFLVWIMYYAAQISKQSNEMITDFRDKMEELDESIHDIKDKVSASVDSLANVSSQVSNVVELVRGFSGADKDKRNRKRKATKTED